MLCCRLAAGQAVAGAASDAGSIQVDFAQVVVGPLATRYRTFSDVDKVRAAGETTLMFALAPMPECVAVGLAMDLSIASP